MVNTPTRGPVELSNHDFIAVWAQQHGASHEDWEINEELAAILDMNNYYFVAGLPVGANALKAIATTVLWVGEQFLSRVDQDNQQGT
jgi:hypothetical protein